MSVDGTTRVLGAVRVQDTVWPVGTVVGEWRVVRHLATGGFGTVYEVVHGRHGLRGALKALHAHMVTSAELVARMVREANVIARLRHRNVVELLDASMDDEGRPYLVMEFLEGVDLAQHLATCGRVAPDEALGLLEPLCDAVAAAHELGVIHRDIKASNAFLCDDGPVRRVVLLDFGIAKLLDVGGADLTASRQALGTPASMAPEQIRGGVVDARSDVYALGALAYHLLTGHMPFDDASTTMSQYLHLHAARPRPSASAPLGSRVDEVVVKAMAVEPERRYPDALSFFAALRSAIAEGGAREQRTCEGFAIRVSARVGGDDPEDAALDDADAVLAAAEALLAAHGFGFVRDLGDASLFFSPAATEEGALAAATALARTLAARTGHDARVAVAIWVHRGAAEIVGDQLVGGPLADPVAWGLPDHEDGLWITAALAASGGARLRLD